MPIAEWILTFDDGPLPGDLTVLGSDSDALAPLTQILDVLAIHLATPISAVFFLRGPDYPWKPPAPDPLIQAGVRAIDAAGHALALHCYRHDPDLWWGWPVTADEIWTDLNHCARYFAAITSQQLGAFRPPYGQGGLSAMAWATENHR